MKNRAYELFNQADWPDRFAILGLVLICGSVYLVVGWPGVLGFMGVVFLLLGAYLAGTKPKKGEHG